MRWLITVLLPALLLVALGVGLHWAGVPSGGAPPVATGPGEMAWADTLSELDARRSLAFAAEDAAMLADVYAPDSAALVADSQRLDELRAAGVSAHGLRLTVLSATVRHTGPGEVVLQVRDRLEPYELRAETGDIVASSTGRGEREWLVTLVPAGQPSGEWRIDSIEPARSQPSPPGRPTT
ncbi:MAG: hypothetical protein L0Y54_20190 [Sporichthyaceae bacterium]|nr:hypothetical protein [Sporichthyaceae bacterium]